MISAGVAVAAAVVVVGLLVPSRLPLGVPSEAVSEEVSSLRRWRLPLSTLAGVAGWAFLGGLFGCVAALGLGLVAFRVLSRARSPAAIRRNEQMRADYPLVVQLLAQALAAGADIESGLRAVGDAIGEPWRGVVAEPLRALRLGRPAEEVWAELEAAPRTSALGRALARSQETGVPVADALHRLADSLREQSELEAQARIRAVEVRAALPLGVCFLPAFVLLGVVPLVAGVMRGLSALDGQ